MGFKQANLLQCHNPSTFVTQALDMASNAEKLDQQSNFKEAVHAYEQACGLLQGVIMRSGSIEERMSYGHTVSEQLFSTNRH